MTDDWHYRFLLHDPDYEFSSTSEFSVLLPDQNEKLVGSFSEVLRSVKNQYLTIGGRAVNHFFIIFLLYAADKWLFNILNALVFALLGYFIYRIAAPESEERRAEIPWLLPFVYLLEFTLPQIGDNVFWMAGAVNYLWPSMIMAGCLLAVRKWFYSEKKLPMALVFPLMLLASSTNEISGGMLGVAMFVQWLSDKEWKKRIPRYAVSVLLFIAGEAFVVLAPGNFNRAENFNQVQIGETGTTVTTAYRYFKLFLDREKHPILIITAFVLLFYPVLKKKDIRIFSYAAAALAGCTAFGASCVYIERVSFYPITLMYITLSICFVRAWELMTAESFDLVGRLRERYAKKGFFRLMLIIVILAALADIESLMSNVCIYFFVCLFVVIWVLAYCRAARIKVRDMSITGFFGFIYRKAPLVVLSMAPIPWSYLLVFGKDGWDAALHYVVVEVKVSAVIAVIAMTVWLARHDKLEQPKSLRVQRLIKRFSPSSVRAYFADYKNTQAVKAYGVSLAVCAAMMIGFVIMNTVWSVPYLRANARVWDEIERKAAAGEKVIEYERYPSIDYPHKCSFCVNHVIMDINVVAGSWAEAYYDITLVGYGDRGFTQMTEGEKRLRKNSSA